jgi:hypothetical protein
MNTEDVFGLVRSGHLFAAVTPQALRQLHILRRFYGLDCPNTYQEVNASDAGIARGQQLDSMVQAVLDQAMYPRVFHTLWASSASPSGGARSAHVKFSTVEDTFYYRGCLLHTAPRRCEHRRSVDIVIPAEQPVVPDTLKTLPAPVLQCATGTQLQSIAVVQNSLTRITRHRCSIQVLSLPNANQTADVSGGLCSPSRNNSTTAGAAQTPEARRDHSGASLADGEDEATPSAIKSSYGQQFFSSPLPKPGLASTSLDRASLPSPSRQRAEAHHASKASHPQCCFGIYCPELLPEEPRVGSVLTHDRALFTSRRWLGLYWADGNAVASLALLGTVSVSGQPTAKVVQGDVRIAVGDVITIETRPECDPELPGVVLFYVNNKEVARASISLHSPVATHMDASYFAVTLSTGASVGIIHCSP